MTAQEPRFEEEGFRSPAAGISLVNGMATDSNNCVWLTTQSGIYRYDGMSFRHYSTMNSNVLKFERMAGILNVLEGKNIRWVMTDAKGGAYQVDKQSQLCSFENITTGIIYGRNCLQAIKNGVAQKSPSAFIEYACYSPGTDRFYFLEGEKLFSRKTSQLLNGEKIPSQEKPLAEKMKFDKLFATNNGLYLIDAAGLRRIVDESTTTAINFRGDILSAGKNINYDEIRFLVPPDKPVVLAWYRGNVYEIIESIKSNSLETRLLAQGSANNYPSFLYYSPVHQLLLGCYLNKGLLLYTPRQFSLLTYKSNEPVSGENYYYVLLPADNGYITVNASGIIWLGLNGTSRMLYAGKFANYFLQRDKKGNIWFNENQAPGRPPMVGYLEAGTYKPVFVYTPGPNNLLAGIHQFDDSTYYILNSKDFQKLIYNRSRHQLQHIYTHGADQQFGVLYQKSSNVFWIGHDRGLFEYTISTNMMKPVTALTNSNVRAITRIGDDKYLIGTYDKWIYLYEKGKWMQLFSADQTIAPSAHAFIVDSTSNSIWVSSNRGISRLPWKQIREMKVGDKPLIYAEHFEDFGRDISVEFNGSSNVSGARLSVNNAAFANATGLVTFDPGMNLSPPLPVNILAEPLTEGDSAGRKDRQLRFTVAVPYFGNRGNLEVLYRLSNTGEEWHEFVPNTIISYNDLSPGPHELEFRVRHYNDPNSEEVAITANRFEVPYRWYQKPWFRIAALLVLIALVVLIHNLRIWVLKKRKKELEKIVELKTHELRETNENLLGVISDLSESEANLKQSNFLKDEYYALLTHDLRSPLKFLSFNIRQLLELLPDIESEVMKKGLLAAYQCSNDVYKLIDEFMYWIQENENQLAVKPVPVLVPAVIDDIKKLYGFNLENNNNRLSGNISPDLHFVTDPKLLFIILRNAIDNANKYSANGMIQIDGRLQGDHLEVTVKDNGRGMSQDLVAEMMGLQHRDEQLSHKQRRSLGFYIMAMLTKKLGGQYRIQSEKNKGTDLSFLFPPLKTN